MQASIARTAHSEGRTGSGADARRRAARRRLALAAVVVASAGLLLGIAGGLAVGARAVPPEAAWRLLWNDDGSVDRAVVWDLRLPRHLVGALVGANLAVAGAVMQGVTRNPLAAPGLSGATAGAALAIVAALVLAPGLPTPLLPVIGFAGAGAGGGIALGLAWKGSIAPVRLALTGVAVSAGASAITTALLLTAGPRTDALYFWLAGGLAGRGWFHLGQIWAWSVGGLVLALLAVRPLTLLALGDEVAASLGLRVARWRLGLVAVAVALTGAAVSVAGPIGFIGLVVPHGARLVGADQRWLLPTAALFGATLLVLADIAARVVLAPRELPVGLLTAALGVPFFVALLRRQRG